MSTYTIASIILTMAVVIAYLNYRFVKIPSTIAIMIGALLISFIILIIDHTTSANIAPSFVIMLKKTDFHDLLLNGMLSFLLFAGAMHIDFSLLKSQKWEISILSIFSTIASTLLIGYASYILLPILGLQIHVPLLYCILFGALISPTDPIAVIAIIKEVGAPKRLETIISGESLFNDGVAIVLFVTLYDLAIKHTPVTAVNVFKLFGQQALGGIAFGLVLGYFTSYILKQCRDINIIILVMLAIVMGGYHLALSLDISGPLAMVVTGIMVGDKIKHTFEKSYHDQIIVFWDIIDELLNAALFLLIGFEMLTIHAQAMQIVAILCAIPIALIIRFITVAIPIKVLDCFRPKLPHAIRILTWGGLRGGLAVALVLSLPHNRYRDFLLAMTYGVVTFSIIIQGLTMKILAKKAVKATRALEKHH